MDANEAQSVLIGWYAAHGRHALPWRLTRDPYAVLVSEVMLQQTQVERVLPYYERWLARWPTIRDLAVASPAEVIREWAGLGYNRRALYLHRAAVEVVAKHAGELPTNVDTLRGLPGIGPYTAAAVACFAGEAPVPVADTNIQRLLARVVLGVASQKQCTATQLRQAATALLPAQGARDHNLALMDLGATVCGARAPGCDRCPLRAVCRWQREGAPEPVSAVRRAVRFEETARFARGRIVDALREAAHLTAQELAALLPERHRPHLPRYLFGLESDGLVEQYDGAWRLPAQGSNNMASPKL
jgi:A/G-specific adenine glycosylase